MSRNERGVWSFNSGSWIKCCWFECDRQGYELYKTVLHEHVGIPCDHRLANHVNFVFCSERHRQYYLNSHVSMGNLPKGYNNVS